jgi:Fe2+ transport system protein FeoA
MIVFKMKLIEAKTEEKLRVLEINSSQDEKRKLSSMGIHTDDFLIRLAENKWGPVLIQKFEESATKLAIGREIAKNILVEYVN